MNSIPNEIIYYIFEYLSEEDLIAVGTTCKRFHSISESESLPARLMIPKLRSKIIQENALMLWNYLEEGFNVDNEGRLVRFEFYHSIKSLFYRDNDLTFKVNKIVEITLQEIYRLNLQGTIKKRIKSRTSTLCPLPCKPVTAETICPSPCRPPSYFVSTKSNSSSRLYVWDFNWVYSQYFPADYLADKILNSERFASQNKICKAALLVKSQANLYDKIRQKYLFLEGCQDERVVWDGGIGITEALFCKNFKGLDDALADYIPLRIDY